MKAHVKNLLPASPSNEAKNTGIFYEKFLKLIPEIQVRCQELNKIIESKEIVLPLNDEFPFQEEIDGVDTSFTITNINKLQKKVDTILKTLPKSSQEPAIFKTHIAPIMVFLLLFSQTFSTPKNSAIIDLIAKICAIAVNNDLTGSRMYFLYQRAIHYLSFQEPFNIEKFQDMIDAITSFSCKDNLSLLKEIRLACITSQLCHDVFLKQKNLQFLGIITTLLHRAVDIFNQKKGDFPNENYYATIYGLLVASNLDFLDIYLLPGISHGLNNSIESLIAYTHRFSLKNFPEKIPETARQTCLSKVVELCKKNISLRVALCELADIFIPKTTPLPGSDNSLLVTSIMFISNLRSKIYEEKPLTLNPVNNAAVQKEKQDGEPEEKLNLVKKELKTKDNDNYELRKTRKKNQELESSIHQQIQLKDRVQDLQAQLNNKDEELKEAYHQIDKFRTTNSRLQTSLFHSQYKAKKASDGRDRYQIGSESLNLQLCQSQAELKKSHKDYLRLLKINSRLEDKLHGYRRKLHRSEDNFFKLYENKKICLSLQANESDRQIEALKETVKQQNQQIINLQIAAGQHNPAFFRFNPNQSVPWPPQYSPYFPYYKNS